MRLSSFCFVREDLKTAVALSIVSLLVRVCIMLEGALCYPARGASCLSAEYAWQQLMPDVAALVRSLCVAVEAWPPEVPKPHSLEVAPGDLATPLGLQHLVRPSVVRCSARALSLPLVFRSSHFVLARKQCLPA